VRGGPERAGVEPALGVAVEGDALALERADLVGRLTAEDLDRVLVAEVVRALDGVARVLLPVVVVVDRGVDPTGRGDGVRAHGMDLGDDRHRGPGPGGGERRALAGEAGAEDEDVVGRHAGIPIRPGTGGPRGGLRNRRAAVNGCDPRAFRIPSFV
jgi:hypothetical protein